MSDNESILTEDFVSKFNQLSNKFGGGHTNGAELDKISATTANRPITIGATTTSAMLAQQQQQQQQQSSTLSCPQNNSSPLMMSLSRIPEMRRDIMSKFLQKYSNIDNTHPNYTAANNTGNDANLRNGNALKHVQVGKPILTATPTTTAAHMKPQKTSEKICTFRSNNTNLISGPSQSSLNGMPPAAKLSFTDEIQQKSEKIKKEIRMERRNVLRQLERSRTKSGGSSGAGGGVGGVGVAAVTSGNKQHQNEQHQQLAHLTSSSTAALDELDELSQAVRRARLDQDTMRTELVQLDRQLRARQAEVRIHEKLVEESRVEAAAVADEISVARHKRDATLREYDLVSSSLQAKRTELDGLEKQLSARPGGPPRLAAVLSATTHHHQQHQNNDEPHTLSTADQQKPGGHHTTTRDAGDTDADAAADVDELHAVIAERDELYEILRVCGENENSRYDLEKRLAAVHQETSMEQQRWREKMCALEAELEASFDKMERLYRERDAASRNAVELQNALTEAETQLAQQTAELTRTAETRRAMETSAHTELIELRRQLETARVEAETRLANEQGRHQQALEQCEARVLAEAEERTRAQLDAQQAEWTQKLAAVNAEWSDKTARLHAEHADHAKQLEQLTAENAALVKSMEMSAASAEDAATKQSNSSMLEVWQRDARIHQLELQLQQAGQAGRDREAQLETDARNRLRDTLEQERRIWQLEQTEAMAGQRHQLQQTFDEREKRFETEQRSRQTQIDQLQAERDALKRELAEQTSSHATQLQAAGAKASEQLDLVTQRMRQQHGAELDSQLELMRDRYDAELEQSLQIVETQIERRLEQMEAARQQSTDALSHLAVNYADLVRQLHKAHANLIGECTKIAHTIKIHPIKARGSSPVLCGSSSPHAGNESPVTAPGGDDDAVNTQFEQLIEQISTYTAAACSQQQQPQQPHSTPIPNGSQQQQKKKSEENPQQQKQQEGGPPVADDSSFSDAAAAATFKQAHEQIAGELCRVWHVCAHEMRVYARDMEERQRAAVDLAKTERDHEHQASLAQFQEGLVKDHVTELQQLAKRHSEEIRQLMLERDADRKLAGAQMRQWKEETAERLAKRFQSEFQKELELRCSKTSGDGAKKHAADRDHQQQQQQQPIAAFGLIKELKKTVQRLQQENLSLRRVLIGREVSAASALSVKSAGSLTEIRAMKAGFDVHQPGAENGVTPAVVKGERGERRPSSRCASEIVSPHRNHRRDHRNPNGTHQFDGQMEERGSDWPSNQSGSGLSGSTSNSTLIGQHRKQPERSQSRT